MCKFKNLKDLNIGLFRLGFLKIKHVQLKKPTFASPGWRRDIFVCITFSGILITTLSPVSQSHLNFYVLVIGYLTAKDCPYCPAAWAQNVF